MRLRDLLSNKRTIIEYRTYTPDGADVLSGYCVWTGNELIPLDKDDYSLDDIIESYERDGDSNLIVWYKSRWIK